MTTIQFLAEWTLRSSILILSGALLLRALRVKDASIRLAAWTAMMGASLAMPAITAALPKLPLAVMQVAARPLEVPVVVDGAAPAPLGEVSWQSAGVSKRFDWALAALIIYVAIAGALLLRLFAGLALSLRLLRGSRATGRVTEGIEIRESDRVAAPVALGIARPAIVLPGDWRQWDGAKLDAVLAHERSHIRRNDPAVQLLSAIHRALLWHSPLSWLLHRRIVRVAEEVSDDAAMAVTRDRASYAEVLLEFMQRGVRGAGSHGVAMARYGRPDERIHRILNGTALSGGVTRLSVAAILALGVPVAYVAAAAQAATPVSTAAQATPASTAAQAAAQVAPVSTAAQAAAQAAPVSNAPQAQAATPAAPAQAATPRQSGTIRRYMIFSGDSTSGSWDSRDPVDQEGLRARFGRNFAWFRQAGNEYVVTDAGVLAELQEAMAPQKEVNRMQSEVNVQQAAVGVLQTDVNSQQSDVNALQQEVNRRQDLVKRIQASASKEDTAALIQKLEAAIRELRAAKADADQETVNRRQAQVNEAQARVNVEQGKVNEQQHKVNDEQRRVSAAYSGRIEEILDSAVRRHLAQQLM